MKDQFLPPPFGDSRASWIINDVHHREEINARRALTAAGMSAADADDYVRMLVQEFYDEDRRETGATGC